VESAIVGSVLNEAGRAQKSGGFGEQYGSLAVALSPMERIGGLRMLASENNHFSGAGPFQSCIARYGETLPRLPWQIYILDRVRQKQLPPHRLPQRRKEDCVRLANRACRQLSVEQFAVERLDFRRQTSPSGREPSRGRMYCASRVD